MRNIVVVEITTHFSHKAQLRSIESVKPLIIKEMNFDNKLFRWATIDYLFNAINANDFIT